MILYSVEPLDRIFPPKEHAREFVEFEGGTLEGYRENGHFTVSGLISTDPALFLDEKFSPGSVLRYGRDRHSSDSRQYAELPLPAPEGADYGFLPD